MGNKQSVAFLSYVRSDDKHENERLTQFCERLSAEVKMQTGEKFPIFQDRKDIKWGQNWKERIENTLDEVTFLIPIITPSFFKSTPCRDEFKRFIERENNLNRNDLILPVYYVSSDLIEIKERCVDDDIATIIASRQLVDWRNIRFEPPTAPEYGKKLAEIAVQIKESLVRVQQKVIKPEPNKVEADTNSEISESMIGREKSLRIRSTSVKPIFDIPKQNQFFTGREIVIEQLHEKLKENGATALSQPQAISGLGGIGKTQTAIKYAYKYKNDYKAVFWVYSDSKGSLISSYVKIASLLNLPVKDDKNQELIVYSVKHWLENNSDWLLIFDNADNTEIIEEFFPVQTKGHILLTSRAQIFSKLGIMYPIKMDEMSPDESKNFLLTRTGRNIHSLEQIEINAIEKLGEKLYYFPLALEQAGAYIHEKFSSFNDYLISYHNEGLKLLEKSKSDKYKKTVATTWSLNFEQIEQNSKDATDLLYVSAFLSPYSIPLELIARGANQLGPVLSTSLADVVRNPVVFDDVLDPLTKYSLINRDPNSRSYSIHRMVQAVLKERMDNDTQLMWAERTVKAVYKAFPDVVFKNWSVCERMIPHVKACRELIENSKFEFQEAAGLLNEAGNYLKERGLFGESKPFFIKALDIRKKVLGEDNLDLAETFNDFAGLYQAQGKYEEAEKFYNKALDIRKKVLGKDDPDLAETFNDFAGLYQAQSKYEEAEKFYNKALDIRKKVLGEDDPDLAETFNNFAGLYQVQGKYEEAEEFFNKALEINKKIFGENHPDYASIIANLGSLYQAQGKYEKAEEFHNKALEINKKILGENHPDYATIIANLGSLYRHQGKYKEAEEFHNKALEIKKKILGENHPSYAITIANLGSLYQDQGKYEKAEEFFNKVSEINKKILGENHPDYATIIANLGLLYRDQGKYEKAEEFFNKALEINKKILGENHPDYATTLGNLGLLYRDQGKYKEAENFFNKTLEINKKILGENHPNYATTLGNLGLVYQDQGRYEEAEEFYNKALEIKKKIFGENHPDCAITLGNLGLLYQDQGRYKEAEEYYNKDLEINKKTRGENHPDYATTLGNLGSLYQIQGKYLKAKPLLKQAVDIVETSLSKKSPLIVPFLTRYANCLMNIKRNREAAIINRQIKAIQGKQIPIKEKD